jgi:hypothetical protein
MTINLINGKKYIGIDSNNDPSYLGSGLYIKESIKKYGRENFKKEILEVCQSKQDLQDREKYWILFYDAVKSDDFYNIHEGGTGGDITIYMSDDEIMNWKKNISLSKVGKTKGIPLSEKNKKGISDGLKRYYENGGKAPCLGKKMSLETCEKISKSNKNRKFTDDHLENLKIAFKDRDYNGENNPFYGKGDLISGEKNPMFGRSFYDVWVEKYGKEVADKKLEEFKEKKRKKKIDNGADNDTYM